MASKRPKLSRPGTQRGYNRLITPPCTSQLAARPAEVPVMTTSLPRTKGPSTATRFRLPDPVQQHQDEKTTGAKHLGLTGNVHNLIQHLGNPDTTIVGADLYIVRTPARNMAGSRYPDLLVSFNADPESYYRSNGYIIAEQGKPPDFVLEIASPSTGHIDTNEKRDDYAALGITEYWRFDETGEHHGARLAGDQLENGGYASIPIAELATDTLQGRSEVLNLNLRWEQGHLGLYVPATGRHIATLAGERAARIRAEAEAHAERLARMQAQALVRELANWRMPSGSCATGCASRTNCQYAVSAYVALVMS